MAGPLVGYGSSTVRREWPAPRRPEFSRTTVPMSFGSNHRAGDPFRRELEVAYSVFFNRSKRSITLNLQDSGERETLFGLLEGADVFIQSWQPGVADRLGGVGYEAVHERNPALVYCSISGFGADSEHRDLPGHEALVHALLGTMGDQAGFRDGPIFVGVPSASSGAAYLGLIGILSSLYRRKSDGWGGRHVETSLLDGMIAYVSQSWGYSAHNKQRYRTGGTRFLYQDTPLRG